MGKNRMFEGDWDPYDILMELSEKQRILEQAHNNLAREYVKTQKDLDIALQSLNSLQKGHLALSEFVTTSIMVDLTKK